MQKINDLFGKRVISQATGDQVASVRDIVLDPGVQRIVGLVIGNGRARDEQVARWPQILGVGEFVIIDGHAPLLAAAEDPEVAELRKGAEQITGKKVISANGEQLGTIGDMYFGRDGAIKGFELRHGMFSGGVAQAIRAADVQAVGRDAVIVTTSEAIPLDTLDEDKLAEPWPDAERPADPELYPERPVDPELHTERPVEPRLDDRDPDDFPRREPITTPR